MDFKFVSAIFVICYLPSYVLAESKHVYYCTTDRAVAINCDFQSGSPDCSKVNHGRVGVKGERFKLSIEPNIFIGSKFCNYEPMKSSDFKSWSETSKKRMRIAHKVQHEVKMANSCNPAMIFMMKLDKKIFPMTPFLFSFDAEKFYNLSANATMITSGEGLHPKEKFIFTLSGLNGVINELKQGQCELF